MGDKSSQVALTASSLGNRTGCLDGTSHQFFVACIRKSAGHDALWPLTSFWFEGPSPAPGRLFVGRNNAERILQCAWFSLRFQPVRLGTAALTQT